MKLGFTGTDKGATDAQRAVLRTLIREGDEVHHGDCVGADAQCAAIATLAGAKVWAHPPLDAKKRAYYPNNDRILPAKEYMARNDDIVVATEMLIACPSQSQEVLRSGTWATIRRARALGKPIILILPDGRCMEVPR